MFGPVLKGEKVVLRPPKPGDMPAWSAWLSDLETISFFSNWFVLSAKQQEEEFEKAAKSQDAVLWSLETSGESPVLIGQTTIGYIDWVNGRAETDILIGAKGFWRKGIATEAMALRTAYAFRYLNLRKLRSCFFEGSRRALLKTGYQQNGRRRKEIIRDGKWIDRIEMEILKEDWEKQNSPVIEPEVL